MSHVLTSCSSCFLLLKEIGTFECRFERPSYNIYRLTNQASITGDDVMSVPFLAAPLAGDDVTIAIKDEIIYGRRNASHFTICKG